MATLTERIRNARAEMDALAASSSVAEQAIASLDGTINSGGGGGGVTTIGPGGNAGVGGGVVTIGPGGNNRSGPGLVTIGPGGNVVNRASVTIGPNGVSRDAEFIAKSIIGAVGGLSKAIAGDGGLLLRSGSGL